MELQELLNKVLNSFLKTTHSNQSAETENLPSPNPEPIAALTIAFSQTSSTSSPSIRKDDKTPPYISCDTTLNLSQEELRIELPSLSNPNFSLQSELLPSIWPQMNEKCDADQQYDLVSPNQPIQAQSHINKRIRRADCSILYRK